MSDNRLDNLSRIAEELGERLLNLEADLIDLRQRLASLRRAADSVDLDLTTWRNWGYWSFDPGLDAAAVFQNHRYGAGVPDGAWEAFQRGWDRARLQFIEEVNDEPDAPLPSGS